MFLASTTWFLLLYIWHAKMKQATGSPVPGGVWRSTKMSVLENSPRPHSCGCNKNSIYYCQGGISICGYRNTWNYGNMNMNIHSVTWGKASGTHFLSQQNSNWLGQYVPSTASVPLLPSEWSSDSSGFCQRAPAVVTHLFKSPFPLPFYQTCSSGWMEQRSWITPQTQ